VGLLLLGGAVAGKDSGHLRAQNADGDSVPTDPRTEAPVEEKLVKMEESAIHG